MYSIYNSIAEMLHVQYTSIAEMIHVQYTIAEMIHIIKIISPDQLLVWTT